MYPNTVASVVLPIAYVTDEWKHEGDPTIVAFCGEDAEQRASEFIGTLPDHEEGRYGLSVSDDQCPSCGDTFSSEAWSDGCGDGWRCPTCGELDTRPEPDPSRRPKDDPDSRRFVVRIDAWTEAAELESHQVEGLLSAAMETFGLDPRDFLVDIEEVLA